MGREVGAAVPPFGEGSWVPIVIEAQERLGRRRSAVGRCVVSMRSLLLLLIMAALRSRCGHYIFVLWFLLSSSFFFFPRLISAVLDWMSTILLHMM